MSAEHGTRLSVYIVDLYQHGTFRLTLPRSASRSGARKCSAEYNRRHALMADGRRAKWRRFKTVAPLPAVVAKGGAA